MDHLTHAPIYGSAYSQILEYLEELVTNKLAIVTGASMTKNKKFHKIDTSGLYYNCIIIVIYASMYNVPFDRKL